MRPWLPLLVLACASTAHADAVADLKTKLQALRADVPLKGTLEADYQAFDEKGVAVKAKAAHLQLGFDSKDGLNIHLSPELVQSLSAEEAKNVADPDSPTPQADLLRQMGAIHIQRALSASDALSRSVEGATSSSAKTVSLDGAPATQLDFVMPLKLPKDQADAAKDWQDLFTVWVDAQGVPLRFQEKIHVKFCKFLLCLDFDQSYGGTERVIDGRLVTVSGFQETQQTGHGLDFHSKTVSSLQIQ
ncbi:MAG TPA: hypothetical protein VGM16_04845 [Gammaproteobacteria bacterium]|jgi:hypothetical protein